MKLAVVRKLEHEVRTSLVLEGEEERDRDRVEGRGGERELYMDGGIASERERQGERERE